MLYCDDSAPKIQAIVDITNQNEIESDDLFVERCPESSEVSGIRVDPESHWKPEKWNISPEIPKQLCAAEAWKYQSEEVDFRPHIYDPLSKQFCLADSGSQVTAWPPDPGDREDPSLRLRAVNNTHMKCYGFKQIEIRIGRKSYKFKAIKSEVDTPVIGWDFMRKHRLEIGSNNFGDNVIRDKIANTSTVLPFKPVPVERSVRQRNLCLVEIQPKRDFVSPQSQNNLVLMEQIAAVESLDSSEKKGK